MTALRSGPVDLVMPPFNTGYGPPVTLLVACKNEQYVLPTLMPSLLAADYPPDRTQIVIVDDASSDRTGEILDEIRRPREPAHGCPPTGRFSGGQVAVP